MPLFYKFTRPFLRSIITIINSPNTETHSSTTGSEEPPASRILYLRPLVQHSLILVQEKSKPKITCHSPRFCHSQLHTHSLYLQLSPPAPGLKSPGLPGHSLHKSCFTLLVVLVNLYKTPSVLLVIFLTRDISLLTAVPGFSRVPTNKMLSFTIYRKSVQLHTASACHTLSLTDILH